jgi:microcystin-dependent protein
MRRGGPWQACQIEGGGETPTKGAAQSKRSEVMRRCAVILGVLALMPVAICEGNGVLSGPTGGGQPHGNVQPSLGVNYLVRIEGDFEQLGELTLFAGTFAPGGWAFADGQLLPIASNGALFSRLGTTYGGDGRTTFALPDLRGRAAMHEGTGAGLSHRTLGQELGVEQVRLTEAQMPAHTHTLPWGGVSGPAGGGQPHTNMQPSLVTNYIIALEGAFPSRGVRATEDPFIGRVLPIAGPDFTIPPGWAAADGQLLPIAGNEALFSILGATYGGDARTTFGLPNLRGRVAIGAGTGPGLTGRSLGAQGGVEDVTLTQAQLPAHEHTLPPTTLTTGVTGGYPWHANMQPFLALNYIIAMEGVYPSSSGTTDETFLGEIALFAGSYAPDGWAFADGQLMPVASHSALFSLLGTTYGGDGRTTFALPDLRGRVPVHEGTGPGLSNWHLGQRVGWEEEFLYVGHLPSHQHVVPEPATATFLLLAAATLALRRRRGR